MDTTGFSDINDEKRGDGDLVALLHGNPVAGQAFDDQVALPLYDGIVRHGGKPLLGPVYGTRAVIRTFELITAGYRGGGGTIRSLDGECFREGRPPAANLGTG